MQDKDIYTVYRMIHQVLDAYNYSDQQIRESSISESIIQALIMTLFPTMS